MPLSQSLRPVFGNKCRPGAPLCWGRGWALGEVKALQGPSGKVPGSERGGWAVPKHSKRKPETQPQAVLPAFAVGPSEEEAWQLDPRFAVPYPF